MTLIYSLRIPESLFPGPTGASIVVKAREISNAFPTTKKNTSAAAEKVVVGPFINEEGREVEVKNELCFTHSFKFMACSLDKLVSNVSHESWRLDLKETKPKGTEKIFKDKIHFVSRKGVYTYDYIDSITKFDKTKLPPKKSSIQSWMTARPLMKTRSMQKGSGKSSKWRRWVIATTFISRTTFSSLQMCLKSSETPVSSTVSSIPFGITLLLYWLGILHWRWQTLSLKKTL